MDKTNLPKIDIDALLALPKCPKLYTVQENRNKAIEYAIWQYVNAGENITIITKNIGCEKIAGPYYWFRKYGVYEKETPERRRLADPGFKRTLKFKRRCKELFDEGVLTYSSIARIMKCNASVISDVAHEDGWAPSLNRRKFKWVVPYNLPENNINDYKTYKLTIYHFTGKIVNRYFTLKQKKLLLDKKYNVDHMLSIYEAFNRGKNPLPWQMIVHPANLQILSFEENNIKGKHSSFNPKELQIRIHDYENKYGEILLPVEIVKIPKYSNRWTSTNSRASCA